MNFFSGVSDMFKINHVRTYHSDLAIGDSKWLHRHHRCSPARRDSAQFTLPCALRQDESAQLPQEECKSYLMVTQIQVTITVNGKESEDVGMLLGPAGEAYFVGEEILGDNPYDEPYDIIDQPEEKQSKSE